MNISKRKKIKTYIIIAIALALAIFVKQRWNVWFGNLPEPEYVTTNFPNRIMLTMGNEGQNSRMVSWQCGDKEDTQIFRLVKKGEKDTTETKVDGVIVKSRAGKTTFFNTSFAVDHGSTYMYQIKTEEGSTKWFETRALADTASSFSFTYLADVQDTAGGKSKEMFAKMASLDSNRAFALFGGDLIERPMDKYWDLVFDDLDTLAGKLPMMACTGNHEYIKGLKRELDSRFEYVFPYFQKSRIDENHVYNFNYNNASFFILDTNVDTWNLPAQREWLDKKLGESDKKWKIVMMHHPIYSNKSKWDNLQINLIFKSIVEKHNVDLVLQGHEHVYARRATRDENEKQTTPLYLSSVSSPKIYHLQLTRAEDRVGTDDQFMLLANVSEDSLNIKTYLLSDNSLYDELTIEKKEGEKAVIRDYKGKKDQKVSVSEWYRKNKSKKRVAEFEKEVEDWRAGKLKEEK